jgi:hypothetical protein
VSAERLVIAVVVLLHELKRPPSLEHVPAEQIFGDAFGQVGMSSLLQRGYGLTQGQVSGAGQTMKAVQASPCFLDHLERLAELAQRLHRVV